MFVKSNTVEEIIGYYQEKLCVLYPDNEIKNITEIMFEHFLGWDKMTLRMNMTNALSESELLLFHKALKRLLNTEPVQYVIGETEFYSLPIKVSEGVLIPRPETEELVDLVIKESADNETILDIGTGSGCIPIAIKKQLKNAMVFGLDVSTEAIEIAKENARLNLVSINFILADILSPRSLSEVIDEKLDVIISNPPYITNSEKKLMSDNVLSFEPHLALFVEDNEPLLFYDKIGQLAYDNLKSGGRLYFEINEHYAQETKALLISIGFSDIRVVKDLQNKDRIVAAVR